MDDERDAECLPRFTGEFRAVGGGGRWELVAVNVRETAAGFFENGTFSQDTRATAAAFGARPVVLGEPAGAVLGLEFAADVILQIKQVGFDGSDVGCGGHEAEGGGRVLD